MIDWYDIRARKSKLRPLSIIIGGRGIGKTYSSLSFILEEETPFIYLRNTDTQLKESASPFGNPFKKLNSDNGSDIRLVSESKHYLINEYEDDEYQRTIGYAAALSTFENLRGVDLSDVEYVVFDEFIEHRRLKFDQFQTFASFIETVNRNRELTGERPCTMILLSNAQMLSNPILAGFNIIPIIERMMRDGTREYVSKDLFVELPVSKVSDSKRDTSLYKLINGSEYAREVIDNEFAYDSFYNIKKQKIIEYVAQCNIDGYTVYKHKAMQRFYVCRIHADCPSFTSKDQHMLFMRTYGQYYREIVTRGIMFFSDFTCKQEFTTILGL